MTRSTLSFVFAALTTTAIAGENFLVYFGTNTNAKNGSKGIYVARFNSASGELTQPELAAEAGNPGFLAIHPSKKYLYAIGDVTTADGKKGGVSKGCQASKPEHEIPGHREDRADQQQARDEQDAAANPHR